MSANGVKWNFHSSLFTLHFKSRNFAAWNS